MRKTIKNLTRTFAILLSFFILAACEPNKETVSFEGPRPQPPVEPTKQAPTNTRFPSMDTAKDQKLEQEQEKEKEKEKENSIELDMNGFRYFVVLAHHRNYFLNHFEKQKEAIKILKEVNPRTVIKHHIFRAKYATESYLERLIGALEEKQKNTIDPLVITLSGVEWSNQDILSFGSLKISSNFKHISPFLPIKNFGRPLSSEFDVDMFLQSIIDQVSRNPRSPHSFFITALREAAKICLDPIECTESFDLKKFLATPSADGLKRALQLPQDEFLRNSIYSIPQPITQVFKKELAQGYNKALEVSGLFHARLELIKKIKALRQFYNKLLVQSTDRDYNLVFLEMLDAADDQEDLIELREKFLKKSKQNGIPQQKRAVVLQYFEELLTLNLAAQL